jgi:hypothetical protein
MRAAAKRTGHEYNWSHQPERIMRDPAGDDQSYSPAFSRFCDAIGKATAAGQVVERAGQSAFLDSRAICDNPPDVAKGN